MIQCIGYGTPDARTPLKPVSLERRDPRPNDVAIAILYRGVCHSDLHQARNDWQNTHYPCVPGHEIVGRVTRVGAPEKPLAVQVFSVIWRRRNFAGSLIGGIAETQERLDFCGKHGITADIEMISISEIETAYTRMPRSDVKYRFVIDMASLPAAA